MWLLEFRYNRKCKIQLHPIICSVRWLRPPGNHTFRGSSDKHSQLTRRSNVQQIPPLFGGCWEEKYVALWSHYPHMPILFRIATFLSPLRVRKCVYATVWEGGQERERARHRNSAVFRLRRQISIRLSAGLSCTHNICLKDTQNCPFHTHKRGHYIVITVRLMLCSPL